MTFQDRRAQFSKYLEYWYLLIFGLITAYFFLRITVFGIPWDLFLKTESGSNNFFSKMLFEAPYYLLGATVFLRYLIQEKYDYKKIAVAAIVFIIGRYVWLESDRSRILFFLLLMLGAKDISFRKIIRVFFGTVSSLLMVTIVCALCGVIENYTYELSKGIRRSFGIVYPTNFAAIVFFQVLCWWYLRKEKTTYLEAAAVLGIAGLLKINCNARCSCICLTGVSVIMVWQRFQYQYHFKKNQEYRLNSFISSVLAMSPIFAAGGIITLTIIYSNNPFLQKLNKLLSLRLSLGKKALDVYGMSLWGQYVRMFGNVEGQINKTYFYIDSSYLQLAIMYGLVALGAVLLSFLLIGSRAKVQRDWTLLWIIAFIAVHGVIEQHLVEIPYCPFILALFANTVEQKGLKLKEILGREHG